MKKLLSVALTLALLVALSVTAAARNLPRGFLISCPDGMRIERDGHFFIDADGLYPGARVMTELVLTNTTNWTHCLSLIVVSGVETGALSLLDVVRLTLVLDGETVYIGSVRGDNPEYGPAKIENALHLGYFAPGEEKILDISLELCQDVDLSASEATFYWQFRAERQDNRTRPPITGDFSNLWLWGAIFALFMVGIVFTLVFFAKRKYGKSSAVSCRKTASLWGCCGGAAGVLRGVIGVCLAGVLVGSLGVFGWFTGGDMVVNEFRSGEMDYDVIMREVFTPPTSVTPETMVPKLVTVENVGDFDAVVRVSVITEIIAYDGVVLPAVRGVQYDFDVLPGWQRVNGFLERELAAGASAVLFESVRILTDCEAYLGAMVRVVVVMESMGGTI